MPYTRDVTADGVAAPFHILGANRTAEHHRCAVNLELQADVFRRTTRAQRSKNPLPEALVGSLLAVEVTSSLMTFPGCSGFRHACRTLSEFHGWLRSNSLWQ